MFALDARNVAGESFIHDYDSALEEYESRTPFAGREAWGAPRPLNPKRRIPDRVFYPKGDAMICRYHETEVVTFHRDGAIDIEGYPSVSTMAFIRALVPHRLEVSFRPYPRHSFYALLLPGYREPDDPHPVDHGEPDYWRQRMLWEDRDIRTFFFEDVVRLRPAHNAHTGAKMWRPELNDTIRLPKSNRAYTTKLLKSDKRWLEFRNHVTAVAALRPNIFSRWAWPWTDDVTRVQDILYEGTKDDWFSAMGGFPSLSNMLSKFRNAVIEYHGGADVIWEDVEWLPGRAVDTVCNRLNKYA